jgi:hypothetical protein
MSIILDGLNMVALIRGYTICRGISNSSNNFKSLYMTKEEIMYILEVIKPYFERFKKEQVLRMTPQDNVTFREIYQKEMGKPLPTCSTCVVDGMLSMIIRAEQQVKELATIADDEQPVAKPKRKRKSE